MDRTLVVRVKEDTWPTSGVPAFPPSFHTGTANYMINIPSMLLMIGYLTTPTSTTGISLSEFWAWVRYLAAVADEPSMRLTRSFADLDAHQKTILSDDFGMGVPIIWLNDRLRFEQILDGRYFMQRMSASVGATQRRSAKRGPNKTPDFVARDAAGLWHVIECKGTQSGIDYSHRQISKGISQKHSIRFPSRHAGQRLTCGLSIGVENGQGSLLTVVNPEPSDEFEVRQDQISIAEDAATRGVVSKVLRLSGYEVAAEATASPLGPTPGSTRYPSPTAERRRREIVNERNTRAQEELRNTETRSTIFDGRYRGREVAFTFPRTITSLGRTFTRIVVKQGVSQDLIDDLRLSITIDQPDFSSSGRMEESSSTVLTSDDSNATLKIGSIFRSEFIME